MANFDPYHRWLGISPKDQPPNHYRLLSIDLFESNPDVIEAAADKQMSHVRTYQAGQHSQLSQKVLNEISAARVCLLNPEKKAEYDESLRVEVVPAPVIAPVVTPTPVRRSASRPAWQPPALVGGLVVVALVIVVLFGVNSGQEPVTVLPKSKTTVTPSLPPVPPPSVKLRPQPEPKPQVESKPTDEQLRQLLVANEWLRVSTTNPYCYAFTFRADGTCEGRRKQDQSEWKRWELREGVLYFAESLAPVPLLYNTRTGKFVQGDGKWTLQIIDPARPTDDQLRKLLVANKWRWAGEDGRNSVFTFKPDGSCTVTGSFSAMKRWTIDRAILSVVSGSWVIASLQYDLQGQRFVGVQRGKTTLSPIEE